MHICASDTKQNIQKSDKSQYNGICPRLFSLFIYTKGSYKEVVLGNIILGVGNILTVSRAL